ncbi:MAG: D-alanine--D-alanine ligase, partial [Candidatus Omnitrophota bacterium]
MKELDALRKYEIGVLAGGSSSEREISLKSGRAVFDALREAGLDAALIDVKEDD